MTYEAIETTILDKKTRLEQQRSEGLTLKERLQAIFVEGIELQEREFASTEEAYEALATFNQKVIDSLDELPHSTDIPLIFSGEGVQVPNLTVSNSAVPDNPGAITILVDKETPFRGLDPFEDFTGYVESVTGSVIQAQPEDPIKLSLMLVAKANDVATASITLEKTPIKVASINILTRALVRISDDTAIQVESLQQYEARKELQQEIARCGLTNSIFKAQLNKLEQALFGENPSEFVELSKVTILHRIGDIGETYARKGQMQSDVVSRAVVETIGRGRTIKVEYAVPFSGGAVEGTSRLNTHGMLVDVLMPSSEDDDQRPTLIVEAHDPITGSTQTHFVEFDRISSFSF